MTEWEAGPATDAEIARRVMGWFPVSVPGGVWWYGKKRGEGVCGPPPYSTDIAMAWRVIEEMQGRRFGCEVWCPNSGGMMPRVKFYPDAWHEYEVAAETVPLAICRAALKAIGAEVPA